jgi:hypothetical protein
MRERQRWLGVFVVVFTVTIGGVAQPLVDRVRAATLQTGTIQTGANTGGTIGTGDPLVGHPATYGPVDQTAPLDFKTQPASVPHNYVGGQLYNVQVLKGRDYGGVLGQMANYTQALGVGCEYCHNTNNFAYDTPTKKIARTMILMGQRIESDHVAPIHKDYPNFAVSGAVGCETCHRGKPQPAVVYNIVPVRYLDWPAKSSRQEGFVLNSMYSVSRSLGVNCLFCHNTADFKTLQYYPTNQIAHRMWRMVDDINHKYLPPNIEAVTCYTCHQGAKWPSELVVGGTDQTPMQAVPAHPEVHENPGEHTSGVQ